MLTKIRRRTVMLLLSIVAIVLLVPTVASALTITAYAEEPYNFFWWIGYEGEGVTGPVVDWIRVDIALYKVNKDDHGDKSIHDSDSEQQYATGYKLTWDKSGKPSGWAWQTYCYAVFFDEVEGWDDDYDWSDIVTL